MNAIATTDEPSRALTIGSRVGRGEVLECVSHGPTGHVYRVHDLEHGQVIAVREYFPRRVATRSGRSVLPLPGGAAAFEAGLRAFMKDARRLSAQDHPALLKVLDVWSEHGTAYVATPWYRGHTMEDVVRSAAGPIAPQVLAVWLRSIADALLPFHRGGGVHGHIHPAQVLVLDTGRPLLLGFSSARAAITKLLPSWGEAPSHPYAAIEVSAADAVPGAWTDVYSLAALSFLAVTGGEPLGPLERVPIDRQEPLSLRTGGPYGYAFLRAIDRGLAVPAHARPQSLAQLLSAAGLPERRARPRGAGESLPLNLPAPHADSFEDTTPSVIRPRQTSARLPDIFLFEPTPSSLHAGSLTRDTAHPVTRLRPADFGGMDAQAVAAGGRTPTGSRPADARARPLLLAGLCAGAVIASLAALWWAVSGADAGRLPDLTRGAGSTGQGTPTTPTTTSGEARTGP